MRSMYVYIDCAVVFIVGASVMAGWGWIIGIVAFYFFIGLLLARISRTEGWNLLSDFGWENIPFWVYLWPWPIAAKIYFKVTGYYPGWGP